jgi:peptide/nickel transport system ATP-binding protein
VIGPVSGPQAGIAMVSEPSAEALVSVRDIHVTFRRGGQSLRALRGVSLDVRPGEILALVGESGSGKSVLGLTMLGLLAHPPEAEVSGSARVCGVDMVTADDEGRRLVRRDRLGAVFQDPMTSLNPTMRVGAQVAEAAGSIPEAIRLLERVGVPNPQVRQRAYPHELSGGLRQRVMIAMAIAGRPSLILADEPTTALDVTVQAQILELLSELRRDLGTSIVLVTHDLGVAAQVADRIAVLYGGRLAELGPADEVFHRPRHPYTAALLRSRLGMSTDRGAPIVALPGEPPDPRQHPPGCPFAPRCEFKVDACDEALPTLQVPVGCEDDGQQVACIRSDSPTFSATPGPSTAPWPDGGQFRSAGRPPAVLVHSVYKQFSLGSGLRSQKLQALRGVSLSIDQGEAVALVGESGCGKSTLLRSIAGLQGVDSGQIEFGKGARPQMVFQDAGASLTPWMTAGALIGERLRGEQMSGRQRDVRVRESLKLVGLPEEIAAAKPSQLSGGQCQRVALARATVVPPEVLLCDEPTSALDVSLAATVLNLIGRLRRDLGMAVLFVTHDLAAARVVADRIAIMYLGRVVEIGGSEEVCSAPIHPYTTALLEAVPDLHRRRVPLAGEPANPLEPPPGCAFSPRCPSARFSCSDAIPELISVGPGAAQAAACPVHLPGQPHTDGASSRSDHGAS